MSLSLEEQERAAYISGDSARAEMLGRLIDAEAAVDEVDQLQAKIEDLEGRKLELLGVIEKVGDLISPYA